MNISFIKIFKVVNVSKKIQVAKFDGNDEKWSRIFYFEIPLASSEIPTNLPGQFSPSGQIFLHWAAATLKGLVGFQNKKF